MHCGTTTGCQCGRAPAKCGRAEWAGRSESASVAGSPTQRTERHPIAALLGRLFDEVGNPVAFNDVVEYIARVQGFDDRFAGDALTTAVHEQIVPGVGYLGHTARVSDPSSWVGLVVTFKAAQ